MVPGSVAKPMMVIYRRKAAKERVAVTFNNAPGRDSRGLLCYTGFILKDM